MQMDKKTIAKWADEIAQTMKEADSCKVEIECDATHQENLNTGYIESEQTGRYSIWIELYIADADKRADLYTRCQTRGV